MPDDRDSEESARHNHPLEGLIVGVLAGLAASWAMNTIQQLVPPDPKPRAEPATAKAANRAAKSATGKPLSRKDKAVGGNLVHYAFGALLGGVYGLMSDKYPFVTRGFGIPFGLVVSVVADEVLVPATGLSVPPSDTPAYMHIYGMASHAVFGASLEAVRRCLRAVL